MYSMPAVAQRFLILILATVVIQACGFQLRGALDISQEVSPLYLQHKSSFELARDLKQLLATNKIAVTDHVTNANSQLVLLKENRQSRVLSVDSDGRVKEYLLTYTVDFSITFNRADDAQSKKIPESISVSRTLLFDQDAVLAVTNESKILHEDMRRDVARLILLKLQARSSEQTPADTVAR